MQEPSDAITKPEPQGGGEAVARASYRIECQVRGEAVVFRCETCDREIYDLRSVYLAHRPAAGWRIECARHADAELAMDAGHLFGGGLRSIDLLADLARARWFDPGELFDAVTRLRAQSRGVYRRADGARP